MTRRLNSFNDQEKLSNEKDAAKEEFNEKERETGQKGRRRKKQKQGRLKEMGHQRKGN